LETLQRGTLAETVPNRGRVGHKSGTRELVVTPMPYMIVYSVEAETVHLLRVIHASLAGS